MAAATSNKRPLLIDTDCGVDDAFALWHVAVSQIFDLRAVTTTHGNSSSHQAAHNVGRVLRSTGMASNASVWQGSDESIGAAAVLGAATLVHGDDGLGGRDFPKSSLSNPVDVADKIEREVADTSASLNILCLGPLTNLACWILKYGDPLDRIHSLTIMGGAVATHGNATAAAEANFARDPEAAKIVLAADWGDMLPLVVPLDATMSATLTAAEQDALDNSRNPTAQLLSPGYRLFRSYTRRLSQDPLTNPCHDLLAAAALAHPEVLATTQLPITVVTSPGPAWGQSIADLRQPLLARFSTDIPPLSGFAQAQVAVSADIERFRRIFRQLVSGETHGISA